VPGIRALTDDEVGALLKSGGMDEAFALGEVDPAVIPDLEVAADGIHLEVSAGACLLDGIPTLPTPPDVLATALAEGDALAFARAAPAAPTPQGTPPAGAPAPDAVATPPAPATTPAPVA